MKSDLEEIKTSPHGEAFERFLREAVPSANYFVAVSDPPAELKDREHAVHLLLGSAFKAGLVEGKLSKE